MKAHSAYLDTLNSSRFACSHPSTECPGLSIVYFADEEQLEKEFLPILEYFALIFAGFLS